MEAPQKIETPSPTPEQLLKLLDLELGRERSKRAARTPRNRASFLAVGMILIIVVGGIALLFAQHLLIEAQREERAPVVSAELEGNR
jgi:hypothetical protein